MTKAKMKSRKRGAEHLSNEAPTPSKKSKPASILNAEVKEAKTPTNFLSLPRELRQSILHQTYEHEIPVHATYRQFAEAKSTSWRYFYFGGCILPRDMKTWVKNFKAIDARIAEDMEYIEAVWKQKFKALNLKHVEEVDAMMETQLSTGRRWARK